MRGALEARPVATVKIESEQIGPRLSLLALGLAMVAALAVLAGCRAPSPPAVAALPEITLPQPQEQNEMSLEQAITQRRSVRSFTDQELAQTQLSQLLWAAQGITDPRGLRAAPSAGALYPLELYVISSGGFYHYQPDGHRVVTSAEEDLRHAVWEAGWKQDPLRDAPAVFLIAAVYQRTENKYGDRTERYVHLEAGHAAQNLLLQAVALGLGGVPIGAFEDDRLQAALSLPKDHAPLYLIPVGYPAE